MTDAERLIEQAEAHIRLTGGPIPVDMHISLVQLGVDADALQERLFEESGCDASERHERDRQEAI